MYSCLIHIFVTRDQF